MPVLDQRHRAEHAVGDVVRKEHAVAAHRAVVEEGVEGGDGLHLPDGHTQSGGDIGHRGRRDVVQRILRLAQHLHQVTRLAPVLPEDDVECSDVGFRQGGIHVGCLLQPTVGCRTDLTLPVRENPAHDPGQIGGCYRKLLF